MRKRLMRISMIALGLAVLLTSCAVPPAAEKKYYAHFAPDPDRIMELSVDSEWVVVKETYFTVYDYMEINEKLVQFDLDAIEERIGELEKSTSLYTSYLENNDLNLEMADKNIEYNQAKYDELKKKYGRNPSRSEKMELQLLLDQIELIKNSKKEVEINRQINQKIYDTNSQLLQDLLDLPACYLSPASGFLLTLRLEENADGVFDIGTMIRVRDTLLEVDPGGLEALKTGQKVKVKLGGQWLDMVVYKVTDNICLRFVNITVDQIVAAVNFLQPLNIELSY